MVATASRTILESLSRLPNVDSRTKICIIGYDTSLYFFTTLPDSNVNASGGLEGEGESEGESGEPGEIGMLVVGDLDDVFLPRPNDILVNLTENRRSIEVLLGKLGDMFAGNHTVGSALGPALQAAYKLIVSNSSRNTFPVLVRS